MQTKLELKNQLRANVPDLKAGQIIRVHESIMEGDKERIQIFEGLVMAVRHGKGLDGTFTVRKIGANQVGVERIFPLHLPSIKKIEILRQEKVRRAKLNYVRENIGKKTNKSKAELRNTVYDFAAVSEKPAPEAVNAQGAESNEVALEAPPTAGAPQGEAAAQQKE